MFDVRRTELTWKRIPQIFNCSTTVTLVVGLLCVTVTAAGQQQQQQQQLTSSQPSSSSNDNFPIAGNYTSLYVEPTASSSCSLVRTNFLNRGMDKKDIPSTFLKNSKYLFIPNATCT
jgi:hypothetical protein